MHRKTLELVEKYRKARLALDEAVKARFPVGTRCVRYPEMVSVQIAAYCGTDVDYIGVTTGKPGDKIEIVSVVLLDLADDVAAAG